MGDITDMYKAAQLSPQQSRAADLAFAFDPAVRNWKRGMENMTGHAPTMQGGDYDLAAALAYGVRPEAYEQDGGLPHWPSAVMAGARDLKLKSPNHPTRWMEDYMQMFGTDPLADLQGGVEGDQKTFLDDALSKALSGRM